MRDLVTTVVAVRNRGATPVWALWLSCKLTVVMNILFPSSPPRGATAVGKLCRGSILCRREGLPHQPAKISSSRSWFRASQVEAVIKLWGIEKNFTDLPHSLGPKSPQLVTPAQSKIPQGSGLKRPSMTCWRHLRGAGSGWAAPALTPTPCLSPSAMQSFTSCKGSSKRVT